VTTIGLEGAAWPIPRRAALGTQMTSVSTVGLLEVEPAIGRFLTSAERVAVSDLVSVPIATAPRGEFTLLREGESFAALVLDGMLFQRLRVANRVALRLLGPGDILAVGGTLRSPLLTQVECRAAMPTQLALLGDEVLSAAGRWPRLMAGLHARIAEQSERLAIQLVICQLGRVEDRLLALLWLLAESWGRVTPVGTAVPVSLTHDALGELIGARRPTVTLALNELSERGAIVRQDSGWLLLESPPGPIGEMPCVQEPRLLRDPPSRWASAETQTDVDGASRLALRETFIRLQEKHRRGVEGFRELLSQMGSSQERSRVIQREVAQQSRRPRGDRRAPVELALSWSGGKDSALALHSLRAAPGPDVGALITTVTRDYDRVSMHGVRRELLVAQACAARLPLIEVEIPAGCTNDVYEQRMGEALAEAPLREAQTIAFGDLFLADIRAYREERLSLLGKQAVFPLWDRDTALLAEEFIDAGFQALIVCLDPGRLDPSFAGRPFDRDLLADLPADVDPCGENGEFHTFVHAGPIFSQPIACEPGEVVRRDGFVFCDVLARAG